MDRVGGLGRLVAIVWWCRQCSEAELSALLDNVGRPFGAPYSPVERTRNVVQVDLHSRANVEIRARQEQPSAARDGPDARVHVRQMHGLRCVSFAWREESRRWSVEMIYEPGRCVCLVCSRRRIVSGAHVATAAAAATAQEPRQHPTRRGRQQLVELSGGRAGGLPAAKVEAAKLLSGSESAGRRPERQPGRSISCCSSPKPPVCEPAGAGRSSATR